MNDKQERVESERVNERLLEALKTVLPWVVSQEVACNGLKCREAVCMSCNPDSEDASQQASDACAVAAAAIAAAEAQQADHIVDATKVVQQEPVAWRVHPFDYGIGHEGVYALTMRIDQVEAWKRKGWTVEPLYAQPQAVAAQPAPAENYSEVQADAPAPATEYSWRSPT